MTVRFYITPLVTDSSSGREKRGPKYFKGAGDPNGIDVKWYGQPYGLMPAMLIAADVSTADHTTLVANSDIIAVPANLDNNVAANAVDNVQEALEVLRIPAGWVSTQYTYRQILRVVAGLFQFSQKYQGDHDEQLIASRAALDVQWNQLSAERQARVQATVDSLGYDTTGITGTTTVRQILWIFAQQWGSAEFYFGDLATL